MNLQLAVPDAVELYGTPPPLLPQNTYTTHTLEVLESLFYLREDKHSQEEIGETMIRVCLQQMPDDTDLFVLLRLRQPGGQRCQQVLGTGQPGNQGHSKIKKGLQRVYRRDTGEI